MVKRILQYSEHSHRELARFTLDGDVVTPHFTSKALEREIMDNGIFIVDDDGAEFLKPSDGRKFFDALERAYGNSSFIKVEQSE